MSRSRRSPFFIARESLFVTLGLLLSLLLLLTLVVFLTLSVIDRENTMMQYEAERSFSSATYLLLQQEHSKALEALAESNVKGIGVYSNVGRLMLGLGSVPNALPLDRFNAEWRARNLTQFGKGVATYNKATGMIEYIRYSRLTIQIETGKFVLEEDGLLPSPMSFPDVLYIVFDGRAHQAKLLITKIVAFLATVALLVFYLLVFNVYRNNRAYRKRLNHQERLVSLGEAARTLAHEIKNPLSAITIQLALLRKELPKENVADLSVIEQEVNRLIFLSNRVSDFLRNPLGQPQEIDLVSYLQTIINTFGVAKITITPNSISSATVWFDPDRARSVFENLLKNAVESSGQNDSQVEVEIVLDRRKFYRIYIRDRGDGIPVDIQDKIFDPFFTTKIQGSGIGLAICRQFLQARGGSIKLSPRDGGGTVVEVLIPAGEYMRGDI